MLQSNMDFPTQPHSKAYVCNHVFDGSRPVLLVSRTDGDWCFLCGGRHEDNGSAYKVVGMGHVIDADQTLLQLQDLPTDREAERESINSAWVRLPYEATRE
jgi:hypothetical protein